MRVSNSLGQVTRTFLQMFGAERIGETREINVDDCIKTLAIPRRRIYDVVNIIESFGMIKRTRKNEYEIKCPFYIRDLIREIEVS